MTEATSAILERNLCACEENADRMQNLNIPEESVPKRIKISPALARQLQAEMAETECGDSDEDGDVEVRASASSQKFRSGVPGDFFRESVSKFQFRSMLLHTNNRS